MARILSIDYGKRRTGLAVTDPLQIIANGLATVSTSELFDWLKAYVAREPVECIVVGKPMQTNGLPSENLQRVEQFVVEYHDGKKWQVVDCGEETTTIGYKRLLRFDNITTRRLRVRIEKARGPLCISEIGAYCAR